LGIIGRSGVSDCGQGEDESFGTCQEPTVDAHEIAVRIVFLNCAADGHAQLPIRRCTCELEPSLRPRSCDALDFLTRDLGVQDARCLPALEAESGEQSIAFERRELSQGTGGTADAGSDSDGLSQEQPAPHPCRSRWIRHDIVCFRCRANLTLKAMTVGVGFELLLVGNTEEPVT